MNEKIIEELKKVPSGTVAVCKRPGTSYHHLYAHVMEETKSFPEWANFAYRKQHVENGMTEPSKCGCGCGETLRNHKKRFLSGHGNRSAEVKARKVSSYMERTGYENPSQNPDVKASKDATCMEHYGAKSHMQSEKGYAEYKSKIFEKMGVENPFQLESVKEKIRLKLQPRWQEIGTRRGKTKVQNFYDRMTEFLSGKFKPLFAKEEYVGCEHEYSFECERCGRIAKVKLLTMYSPPRCLACDPTPLESGSSWIETELREFMDSLGIPARYNDRTQISPLELDVFVPDHKLAIELHGLYWHSETSGKKNENYHLNKYKLCKEKGIRLLQIFEDEWNNRKQVVKARIRNALKIGRFSIGARECEVKRIDAPLKSRFLNKYHVQGNDVSGIRYGLFNRGRLVAVMTFGKFRKSLGSKHEDGSYELWRFATCPNIRIQGGADKLFKTFLREYNPLRVITYADLRWSVGNLYEKLGFIFDHQTKPNYWYTPPDYLSRQHRFNFTKSNLVSEGENPNLTEEAIMKSRGYDRVWDCGSLKYEWKK